jgi:hypothetical protein
MIMGVAHYRLFGPKRIIDDSELKKPRQFLSQFAVNINNTLNN